MTVLGQFILIWGLWVSEVQHCAPDLRMSMVYALGRIAALALEHLNSGSMAA